MNATHFQSGCSGMMNHRYGTPLLRDRAAPARRPRPEEEEEEEEEEEGVQETKDNGCPL